MRRRDQIAGEGVLKFANVVDYFRGAVHSAS